MDFNNFNFEEFLNYMQNNCDFSGDNCKCDCNDENCNSNSQSSTDNINCNDLPNGFQDLAPQLFTLFAQILGLVMAGNMPFNLQNAIGNWLELLGQVILTFNSQQQYFQSGPGRYYNLKYKNATNPFCPNPQDQTNTSSNSNSFNTCNNCSENEINELKNSINALQKELEKLKNKK